VEAFAMGLKLGIGWMPPQLSREVYEALGLRLVVDEAGGMHAEARVDTATIRFSQQVERYAYALREADERLRREELKNPPRGYEVTVPDPEGNPTTLGVKTHQERLERAERELAQVQRELSSSSITAITVSVMLSEVYGKTRQEAAEKLAEAMADRDKGLVFDAGDMTLSEFLNRWLDGMYGTVSHALATCMPRGLIRSPGSK
jgi:hypothetical protein